MLKFKGHLSFCQYLPMKLIKWGVKLWTFCENETGYTVNFQVYTGKDQWRVEHGLGYRVFMDMVVVLHRTSAQVFFDTYFTSVPLMKNLKLLGIQGCCTVHANKKDLVAARFVTMAHFVTKVTKRAAMPAHFVTNEVVSNRAGIAPFFSHLDMDM